MSRSRGLSALLRLLPRSVVGTWVYELARSVADDADRQAARAERPTGERDEARRDRDAARDALAEAKAGREVAERSCVELQCEVDRARAERDAIAVEAQGLRAELAAMEAAKDRAVADSSDRWQRLRAELAAGHDVALPLPAGTTTSCSWCLGPVEAGWHARGERVYRTAEPVQAHGPDATYPLCPPCYKDPTFMAPEVRARVAERFAAQTGAKVQR